MKGFDIFSLTNKVGVVTGGGAGIGRAAALRMAEVGAAVVIANRSEDKGEQTVSLIREAGGRAVFHKTDVSVPGDVKSLVERAVAEFGRLDLAVNNAGIVGELGPLHGLDVDKAAALFDLNVMGTFVSMKYEIEQMLKTGGGVIVNTASILGLKGFAGFSLYAATKHAIVGMTRSAALDYAKQNVRVNAVAPGTTETPGLERMGIDAKAAAAFIPMGRAGKPEDVADAIVWLLSDESRFVTGQTLAVDGGVCAQ